MLRNQEALLAGPTRQVAVPLGAALARDTEGVGSARVHWRDGIRRRVEARNPELLVAS